MITPLFNADDDEWVTQVGRYILNMGAIEMATRLIITRVERTDGAPIFSAPLDARIAYVRRNFPRHDQARHASAMNTLSVAARLAGFRNIVAHGSLAIARKPDDTYNINGILNVTPKDRGKLAELISLEELKGRVNESALVARHILEMQKDFSMEATQGT